MIQAIRAQLAIRTRRLARARCCASARSAASRAARTALPRSSSRMVAAPFLALMFAIMETALVFFAEPDAGNRGRGFGAPHHDRPGADAEFQRGASSRRQVCSKICGLFDCAGGLQIDVKTYSSFGVDQHCEAARRERQPADRSFGYQPGGPGEIVVVRLMYQWPVYVSLLGFNLADMAGSKRLLMATAAFRNEPYQ